MKRLNRILVLFLLTAMLFSLAACGGREPADKSGEPPAPGTSEHPTEQDKSPAPPEPVKPAPPPEDSVPVPWGGDGTLEGFRTWAAQTHTDALAVIGEVGQVSGYTGGSPFWENVQSSGFLPFLTEYSPGYEYWAETAEEDHPEEKQLWCIVPMDQEVDITLHQYRYNGGEERAHIGDIELHPEGEPVLFYWNTICWPEPTLAITLRRGEKEVTFDLEANLYIPPRDDYPANALILPKDGSVFEFMVKRSESPMTEWRLTGRWEAWETGERGDLRNELWIHPDGRLTWWKREREGALASLSAGEWALETDGTLVLSYADALHAGGTGTSLELTPELDEDGALTLISGDGRRDFCDEGGQSLKFYDHAYFLTRDLEEEESLALDAYEKVNGQRPAYAQAEFITQTGVLVSLWDEGRNGIVLPRGWYISEPGSASVRDYVSGELLQEGPNE